MKKGFTIIELLISIILFSLIATFLYGGIDQVRSMRIFYEKKGEILKKHEQIRALLYRDFLEAESITIMQGQEDRNIIFLNREQNSLYGIPLATVVWLVMKDDNTLLRLESAQNIKLPLDPSNIYQVHTDVVSTGCTMFGATETNASRLVTLRCNDEEIFIETPR